MDLQVILYELTGHTLRTLHFRGNGSTGHTLCTSTSARVHQLAMGQCAQARLPMNKVMQCRWKGASMMPHPGLFNTRGIRMGG